MVDAEGLDADQGGEDQGNGDQGAAPPADDGGSDSGGEPGLDRYPDLTTQTTPFQSAGCQWTPAPMDGSVDLTPAPLTGLLGNFKALPFDGTSERWLYHMTRVGDPDYSEDASKPWIISRPIDLTGGTSDGYFRTLVDPTNGPPAAMGMGTSPADPVSGLAASGGQAGSALGQPWGSANLYGGDLYAVTNPPPRRVTQSGSWSEPYFPADEGQYGTRCKALWPYVTIGHRTVVVSTW